MAGAEVPRHGRSVSRFIKGALTESDREGPYRARRLGLHQGHDGRTVYSARQEQPDRNVGNHSVGDRGLEQIASLGDELLVICSGERCAARVRDIGQRPPGARAFL
ncbi:hypothetical protein ACVWZR_010313 [Bradyrhizobium sp. i1.3.1]